MRQVTARYRIDGLCTEAEGLRQHNCIGAEACFTLTLTAEARTMITGSGSVKAVLELVRFVAPDGEDETAAVKAADRVYGPVDCMVMAGRVSMTVPTRRAVFTITAYMMSEGADIAYGHFEANVTGWRHRLMLRRIAGNFGGKLLVQEFSEGA